MSEIKYGNYLSEECCVDCDYVFDIAKYARDNLQAIHFKICPDCGGELEFVIGRWKFSEHRTWYGKLVTNYHGFEKGRKTPDEPWHHSRIGPKLSENVSDDCDCPGCEITDSGHGYQPCHNRDKLIHPPQET